MSVNYNEGSVHYTAVCTGHDEAGHCDTQSLVFSLSDRVARRPDPQKDVREFCDFLHIYENALSCFSLIGLKAGKN